MGTTADVSIVCIPGRGERIKLTRHAIATLLEWERLTEIGILVDKWRRAGGRLPGFLPPREGEFSPSPPHQDNFRPTSENIYAIRVDRPNSLDFVRMNTVGTHQIEPLRTMDNELMRDQFMQELRLVKGRMLPAYHQVDYHFRDVEMNLCRVLLPVRDDDGNVSIIYEMDRMLGQAMYVQAEPDKSKDWVADPNW